MSQLHLIETIIGKAAHFSGMMKHSEGYVLKPVPHPVYGPREINFYKTLETTCDPILKELKQFIPQYLGTTSIELDNKGGEIFIVVIVIIGFHLMGRHIT